MKPSTPKPIRAKTWVAFLASLPLLSACAMLPTSGPVNHSDISVGDTQPMLGLSAPGPMQNATPEQIIAGFIRACAAGYSDEFTVARSFLLSKTALDWRPDKRVQIFDTDSQLELSTNPDGSIAVKAKALGSVDENGHYTVAGSQAKLQEAFSLVKGADDQWRIAKLEDGVILSQSSFSTIYSPAPVSFLSSDSQALVPDLRWYPKRRLPTYLVNALLEGPPEDLKGAVTSAFATGTTLRGGSVEVIDSVARVSLNLTEPLVNENQIALAYWQMESTLVGITGISRVELLDGAAPIEVSRRITSASSPRSLVMMQDGDLVRYNSGNTRELVSAQSMVGVGMGNPSISEDGEVVCFTDRSRTRLYVWSRGQSFLVFSGENVLTASIDRRNWIWTGVESDPASVSVIAPNASVLKLSTPWGDGGKLIEIHVSPDGARLAALRSTDKGPVVTVATIVRDDGGTPTALSAAKDLNISAASLLGISWLKGYSLAVLAGTENGTNVLIAPLFGPETVIPGVKDGVGIAAGTEENEIYIVTSTGELYVRSGRNWQPEATGVFSPRYPG